MDCNETGYQAPERPILCANNCGFFGSATTMNMCSKCYREAVLKDDREKIAASSIENFVNGTSSTSKDSIVTCNAEVNTEIVEISTANPQVSCDSSIGEVKKGPSRCATCRKRVGLTGFSCRCGNMFCSDHRYSDKHECPFDYRGNAQSSIAKANPVIKAAKLDKI